MSQSRSASCVGVECAALARTGTIKAAKRGRFPVAPKEQRTVNGIVFDSAKEARRYSELLLLERAGEIKNLVPQYTLSAGIAGRHLCSFTVDFQYYDNRLCRDVYEEVKSSGTQKDAAYRLRKKAIELHNGVKVDEVVL